MGQISNSNWIFLAYNFIDAILVWIVFEWILSKPSATWDSNPIYCSIVVWIPSILISRLALGWRNWVVYIFSIQTRTILREINRDNQFSGVVFDLRYIQNHVCQLLLKDSSMASNRQRVLKQGESKQKFWCFFNLLFDILVFFARKTMSSKWVWNDELSWSEGSIYQEHTWTYFIWQVESNCKL
jgi:hypothetical protein